MVERAQESAAPGAATSAPLAVECRGVTRRYAGVVANDQIDLEVREGEVHALVGENGAGKSTLMKMLYGLEQPDEGEILVRGEPQVIDSPRKAIELRIGLLLGFQRHAILLDCARATYLPGGAESRCHRPGLARRPASTASRPP